MDVKNLENSLSLIALSSSRLKNSRAEVGNSKNSFLTQTEDREFEIDHVQDICKYIFSLGEKSRWHFDTFAHTLRNNLANKQNANVTQSNFFSSLKSNFDIIHDFASFSLLHSMHKALVW